MKNSYIFIIIILIGIGIGIYFYNSNNNNGSNTSAYNSAKVSTTNEQTENSNNASENNSSSENTENSTSENDANISSENTENTTSENNANNSSENTENTTSENNANNSSENTNSENQKSETETQIADFTTKIYTKESDRQNNISITCSTLNNTFVNSGDTFSFCNTVGKATTAKGYEKADVLKDGETVQALGGGNCQVSTTLYNAVLKVPDLNVTERHEHSNSVPYISQGKDAAVSYRYL